MRNGLRIIALRVLGDPDAADEAVQETLARAVTALAEGRLDDPEKLPAYVAGIARHVCSHLVRDRKQTISLDGDADGTLGAYPQLQSASNPLDALISAAESDRLRAALDELSPDDRHLMRLCFLEGRSPAEVAAALGEPAERVRKRKSRALDRLRRAFLGQSVGHGDSTRGTESEHE
jgi:RNA polymerase sigma factor (sigma-70 family)